MYRLTFLICILSATFATSIASRAAAMEIQYFPACNCGVAFDDPALLLDGTIESGDAEQISKALQRYPDVKEIIVGISPGGSLAAGIEIARLIQSRGLHVKLEGPAASAATVISLGANKRIRFQGDFTHQEGTTLLFHCAYLRGENSCHRGATKLLSTELSALSAWSSDRWFRLLMGTSPTTVQRVSLWDILGKKNWECQAEAHLSVVCHRK